jgi:hypothetical protein
LSIFAISHVAWQTLLLVDAGECSARTRCPDLPFLFRESSWQLEQFEAEFSSMVCFPCSRCFLLEILLGT